MSAACIAAMAAIISEEKRRRHVELEDTEPLDCLTMPEFFGAVGIGVAIPLVAFFIARLMNL